VNEIAFDPSPENVNKAAAELGEFFHGRGCDLTHAIVIFTVMLEHLCRILGRDERFRVGGLMTRLASRLMSPEGVQ
jgi:hypothetical protein